MKKTSCLNYFVPFLLIGYSHVFSDVLRYQRYGPNASSISGMNVMLFS